MEVDAYDLMFRILGRSRIPAEHMLREIGLTSAQGRTIGYIEANEQRGVTARELAEISGTTPASVSSLIGGLERGGYVERRADPTDARSKLLRVLPRGRGLTEDFDRRMALWKQRMLDPLSPEERGTLLRLLTTIDNHLEQGETRS
jgi:MarR family transcriptional regulator, repressor for mepA